MKKGCKGCLVVALILIVFLTLGSAVGGVAFRSTLSAIGSNINSIQSLAGEGSETLTEATAMLNRLRQGQSVSESDVHSMLSRLETLGQQLDKVDDSNPIVAIFRKTLIDPLKTQLRELEKQISNQGN